MKFLRAELAALAVASAYGLKVGILADLHTNNYYDTKVSVDYDCVASSGATYDVLAPLSRFGCDSNLDLIHVML